MSRARRILGRRRVGAVLAAAMLLGGCLRPGASAPALEEKFTRWSRYEGEAGATHFSALDQIDRSNVAQLQVAWSYPNGGSGFNPIIVDSMMYVIGRNAALTALHAGNGRELWTYAAPAASNGFSSNRGLLYWESADRSDRRVYLTRDNYMMAVDAVTGRPVTGFGEGGRVDLRQGIDRDIKTISASASSPGTIFENYIIMGSAPGEAYGSGPGDVRAFDARTGKLAWVFHTIPRPGEFGYESWTDPNAWKTAGAVNVWGGMSVDDKRGIVYLPIGSASYDFYGADRPGSNLFASSLVALDARTGKRLWHFQTTHHDLWDYDLTATPVLLTVKHDGKPLDIVAQATKQGFLFVFDRVTGKPLWPIDERPVPKSEMPGEVTSPTQPFPTWPKPFAVQSFTEADVNPYILDPAERDSIVKRVRESLNLGLYTPPSTRPTMQMPGNTGGANWGSTGGDPRNGSFFVVTKNIPTVLKLERILPGVFGTGTSSVDQGQFTFQQNCATCHQASRQGQPPLIPSLVGVTGRLTAAQIHTVIRQGRATMPAFRDLSEEEVGSIIDYLTSPETATPMAPPVPGSQADADIPGPRRYQTGYGYFTASGGMWAIKPPYTTLTRYDLNTGDIKWQVPVGEIESLTQRGITGTGAAELRGGPAITGGNLVFLMTGMRLRAYDSENGKELWSAQLPAPADGIPAVYQVGGRQYVVVGIQGRNRPDAQAQPGAAPPIAAYVAFALPR